MLNKFNMGLLLAVLLVSITSLAVLAAPPPLPSSFYGTVTLGGQNVPAGTLVSAWINGVQYAETTAFLANGVSVYRLDVPGDIVGTPEVEGGREGDSIRFQVMGFDAGQTVGWHSGTYTQLNLTATAGPVPPIAQD